MGVGIKIEPKDIPKYETVVPQRGKFHFYMAASNKWTACGITIGKTWHRSWDMDYDEIREAMERGLFCKLCYELEGL
jgi:hypothetical protein